MSRTATQQKAIDAYIDGVQNKVSGRTEMINHMAGKMNLSFNAVSVMYYQYAQGQYNTMYKHTVKQQFAPIIP